MTPYCYSQVVLDWLEAVGGPPLIEHVFRVYNKDLQMETLYDIRQAIMDSIETLITESTNAAEVRRARCHNIDNNTEPVLPTNTPVQVGRAVSWGRPRSTAFQSRRTPASSNWPPARNNQSASRPPPQQRNQPPPRDHHVSSAQHCSSHRLRHMEQEPASRSTPQKEQRFAPLW